MSRSLGWESMLQPAMAAGSPSICGSNQPSRQCGQEQLNISTASSQVGTGRAIPHSLCKN
jgi:hypothetical protein